MAIRMRMHWDGVTPDQYDEVRRIVNWEGDPAEGGLLHEAWFVGDQLNVVDIWDSPEAFNAFVQNRLMPGTTEAGVSGRPEVEILPIYNWQLEKQLSPGAVVEEADFPADMYRGLESEVKWRQEPPIGGISHIAGLDGDTIRTVTVWQSQADHDAFEADRIGPAAQAIGGAGEPPEAATFHPIHALFHPEGMDTRS
ncbi:MAG: hypothetical protein M3N98_14275 [Actinomycetota bacterium]|nr:hypothetical protein [Actinomycetota bacterium]